MLKINPNAFMSIIYQNFKISIYKRDSNESNDEQYYYSPALIFDPESPAYAYNSFTKRHEITFAVLMWDDSYEDLICERLSGKLGKKVSRDDILTLPIEEIRMDASGHPDDYEMVNKWTSYASQPSSFEFRIICKTAETCKEITETMKTNPKYILSDIVVYYSLQSQKSIRRLLSIKAEHVQSSALFSVLHQKFIDRDVIYLQADDAKRLSLEIASNVMAMEVIDDEFVSQDQQVTIANLLDNILKLKTVSTEMFETQMWNSVFWQDENSRPDKTTKILNDFYNKSDNKLKELLRTEMQKKQSGSMTGDVGIPFVEGLLNANGAGNINLETLSKEEKEKVVEALNEFKNISEWNEEKFTPKSLLLSRINLAELRANWQIITTQVRVTKTLSELTTRINIVNDTRILENLRKVTEIETFMNRECKKHTETIRNDMLATRDHVLELQSFANKTLETMIIPPGTFVSSSKINGPNALRMAFPQLENSVRAFVRMDYRACSNKWNPQRSSFVVGSDLQNINGPHFGI